MVACPQHSHSLLQRVTLKMPHTCFQLALHQLPSVFRTKTKVFAVSHRVMIWSDLPLTGLSSALLSCFPLWLPVFPSSQVYLSCTPELYLVVLLPPILAPLPLPQLILFFIQSADQKLTPSRRPFLISPVKAWPGPVTPCPTIRTPPAPIYPNCTEYLACLAEALHIYIFLMNVFSAPFLFLPLKCFSRFHPFQEWEVSFPSCVLY